MTSFVIVEIEVNNPEGYEKYKKIAPKPINTMFIIPKRRFG